jgi:hypothetical protein
MPILIVSPRHSEDSDAMLDAATHAGWHVERPDNWRIRDQWLGRDDLAFHGEALWVRVVADQLSYSLMEAPYAWLAELPTEYLQRDVQHMTLGEVQSITEPRFIKPAGDKAFNSAVYETGSVLLDAQPDLSRQISVLISEPVVWEVEIRCFILNREVQTLSLYNEHGELTKSDDGMWVQRPALTSEALMFASRVVTDPAIDIPPAFVMDVGIIRDRGWAVLEANPAWGSGIYGCDPLHVLPIVARACIASRRLENEDRRWIPAWESWEA